MYFDTSFIDFYLAQASFPQFYPPLAVTPTLSFPPVRPPSPLSTPGTCPPLFSRVLHTFSRANTSSTCAIKFLNVYRGALSSVSEA